MDWERPSSHLALHHRAGYVLYIDFQITPVPADGEQTLRFSEQGVEIVELVNLREDHTSTQIRAGGIHLPVVFKTMPTRQILADGSTNSKQAAKHARAHNLLQAQKTG